MEDIRAAILAQTPTVSFDDGSEALPSNRVLSGNVQVSYTYKRKDKSPENP